MNFKISKPELKLNSVCFIIGYVLFLVTLLLASNIEIARLMDSGADLIGKALKLLRYLSYLLVLIGVTDKMASKSKVAAVLLATAFLALEVLFSRNNTMVLYVFLFLGAIGIDSKQIVRISLIVKGCFLFLSILFSQIGLIQDYMFLDGGRNRHGLGFIWTTTGSILYLHILLEYIYVRREKITIIEFAVMELVNIWFYRMTDASMAFYLTTAFILYFACIHLQKKKFFFSKKIKWVMPLFPSVCALTAIWAQFAYNERNPFWISVNLFTHGRLKLGHDAIEKYGITLLGQPMEWIGFSMRKLKGTYNYVDSSYLQLLIEFGILFLLLVLLVYTVLLIRGLVIEDYYLIAILAFLLVFAMSEPRLMNLMYTSFPLLILSDLNQENSYSYPEKYRFDGLRQIKAVWGGDSLC